MADIPLYTPEAYFLGQGGEFEVPNRDEHTTYYKGLEELLGELDTHRDKLLGAAVQNRPSNGTYVAEGNEYRKAFARTAKHIVGAPEADEEEIRESLVGLLRMDTTLRTGSLNGLMGTDQFGSPEEDESLFHRLDKPNKTETSTSEWCKIICAEQKKLTSSELKELKRIVNPQSVNKRAEQDSSLARDAAIVAILGGVVLAGFLIKRVPVIRRFFP